MALTDKSQVAQPVAPSFATLPSRYPELPEEVIKRFPSLADWQTSQKRLYARITEAFASVSEDLSLPINALQTKTDTLSVSNEELSARIVAEQNARIEGDTAIAETISSIIAAAGTSSTVFVQASAPTANSINDVWYSTTEGLKPYYWNGTAWVDLTDTRLTGSVAAIANESIVRANADSALTQQLTSLVATVNGNHATILTTLTSYATISYAEALRAEAISVAAADATSKVGAEATARADADSALSTRTTTLESQVQTPTTGLLARVSTVESTKVDAAGAYAQATSAISASLGAGGSITSAISASVSTEASARVAADGAIHARWGVAIDVNGRITGRVNLNGTNESSSFLVAADKFVIQNGAGTVTLADIRTDGLVFGADIRSDNFSSGSAGWRLTRAGELEVHSGVFRGVVRGGATAFNSGVGFWMGLDGGVYKFRVGDPSGARISWDGSTWTVVNFGGGSAPTFALTLGTSVGNPLYVCTGDGTYTTGSIVTISAPTIPGYTFTGWTGAAYDVASVADPNAQTTTVAVTHATSLTANYT